MVGEKKGAALQMVFAVSDQSARDVGIVITQNPGEALNRPNQLIHCGQIIRAHPIACGNVMKAVSQSRDMTGAEYVNQLLEPPERLLRVVGRKRRAADRLQIAALLEMEIGDQQRVALR